MYEFTDTNEMPVVSLTGLSMLFNGMYLEDEIPGYTTLNVGGRELIGNEITTQSAQGMDGIIITGQTLPARRLTVQFKLEAKTKEECRYNFNQMNYLLRKYGKTDVPIIFTDEPEATYHGRYETADDVPFDRNTVIGSFTLLCVDPYKYLNEQTMTGTSLTVGEFTPYDMTPDEIRFVLSANATKITLDNATNGRHIILNGSYTAGQTVVIDIRNNNITLNGQNIMSQLDFVESDFHEFKFSAGDVITCTPVSTMNIKVRGRWL